MGALITYHDMQQQANQQPVDNAMQPQQPQIDTSDPINSLAGMLVTPAEREAQEQKMLKNKRRMIAWTGLFDGLRNLANLYTVSKGAAPMKFTDNPYQQIEKDYQAESQRQNALFQNRDKYAQTLYNLQRQVDQDKLRQEAHKAQMKWYDTRDEMARLKEERDRLKTEKYIELQDGRIAKINAETGQILELTPYKVNTEKSKAAKNYQQGAAAMIRANNSGKSTGKSTSKSKNSKTTRRRSQTQL